jgi:hypothetical protein
VKGKLRSILRNSKNFDDDLIKRLLISPRKNLHHLLYDEVMELIEEIQSAFPEIVQNEIIGKTYDNRDMIMMKINAQQILQKLNLIPKLNESS